MVVATVKRSARDASTAVPIGPLTRRALEGFRRTDAAAAPPRPAAARPEASPPTSAPPSSPPASACAAPAAALSARRPPSAAAWSTGRSSPCCSTAPSVAARSPPVCWADVDFRDGDDVVVTVRRSKSDPTGGRADVRRLVGSSAAAVRSLHAAISPEPGDSVVGLSVDQIDRRFAAACAAAGLEGRRTSHGGRVGLAVELTARGVSILSHRFARHPSRAGLQSRYRDRAQGAAGLLRAGRRAPHPGRAGAADPAHPVGPGRRGAARGPAAAGLPAAPADRRSPRPVDRAGLGGTGVSSSASRTAWRST